MDQRDLQRCAKRIIAIGKRQGNLITFATIKNEIDQNSSTINPLDTDLLYDWLQAAGIEIVDELPSSETSLDEPHKSYETRTVRKRSAEVARWSHGQRRKHHSRQVARNDVTVCDSFEKDMDSLLLKADAGMLHRSELLDFIEEHELSAVELRQMMEYVISEIEQPDEEILGFCKTIINITEALETKVLPNVRNPYPCTNCIAVCSDHRCIDRVYEVRAPMLKEILG